MTASRTPAQDHTCWSCRHWVDVSEGLGDGLCFRYPPIVFIRHDGAVLQQHPEASMNDRACGEFEVALLPSPPTRWQRFVALFRGAR